MPIETLIYFTFLGTCTVVATLAGLDIIRRTLLHVLTHWQDKIWAANMADIEEKAEQWCKDNPITYTGPGKGEFFATQNKQQMEFDFS